MNWWQLIVIVVGPFAAYLAGRKHADDDWLLSHHAGSAYCVRRKFYYVLSEHEHNKLRCRPGVDKP